MVADIKWPCRPVESTQSPPPQTSVPAPRCLKAADRGTCEVTGAAAATRAMWFFDAGERRCARFEYGGCGEGDANRFSTLR